MGITVHDFIYYCTEASFCNVEIFDMSEGDTVFTGTLRDVPVRYHGCEVSSFDSVNEDMPVLVLNIETEFKV